MLTSLVLCSIALLSRETAFESVPPSDPPAAVSSGVPESRGSGEEASRAYEDLLSQAPANRAQSFALMPSSLKAGVWSHHFLTMLADHPEFTTEQRAVIQEALSILTPDMFAIPTSDPHWSELVDKPFSVSRVAPKPPLVPNSLVRSLHRSALLQFKSARPRPGGTTLKNRARNRSESCH